MSPGAARPASKKSKDKSAKNANVVPFGKYLLLDRIAVGGMAELYLAKSFGVEGFEKLIAIKRILPSMAEDEDFINMFIDEAKIAGHLSHANIVPIYELGRINDSHYIAMEFVWGKDVLQLINRFRRMRKRMPPEMAAWVAARVCNGLAYAHSKTDRQGQPLGLIHRDVSPQNILVNYDGQVKLIDFGIAKAASRTAKTETGVLKGKFGYMSPEQVRGKPVDSRSDLFSLGTCLYEMLVCDRLFISENELSTLELVSKADIDPPSSRVSTVPKEMDAIVMKALAREPDNRYQTAAELLSDLQEFISGVAQPYETTELAAWMRQAFSEEMQSEKSRLDSYTNLTADSLPRELFIGARRTSEAHAPTAPPEPAVGRSVATPTSPGIAPDSDFPSRYSTSAGDELPGDNTHVSPSPFEGGPLGDDLIYSQPESGEGRGYSPGTGDLGVASTEIFFSASELEQEQSPAAQDAPARGAVRRTSQPPGPQSSAEPQRRSAAPAPARKSLPPENTRETSHELQKERSKPTVLALRELQDRYDRLRSRVVSASIVGLFAVAATVWTALTVGAPEPGVIEIRTNPAVAASVNIDGVPRGRTPLRVEGLSEGERLITLEAKGFLTATRRIPVEDGSFIRMEVALMRGESDIASPDDRGASANTELDPNTVDTTPSADSQQDSDDQTSDKSYDDWLVGPEDSSGRSSRSRKKAATTTDEATSGYGMLVINTMPASRVFVDGRDTRRSTPILSLRMPAGKHRIGLQTEDGKVHHVDVDVKDGATVKLIRRL